MSIQLNLAKAARGFFHSHSLYRQNYFNAKSHSNLRLVETTLPNLAKVARGFLFGNFLPAKLTSMQNHLRTFARLK